MDGAADAQAHAVARTVVQLYSPHTQPAEKVAIQSWLQTFQTTSPDAMHVARLLVCDPETLVPGEGDLGAVRFFGALTYTVHIARSFGSLPVTQRRIVAKRVLSDILYLIGLGPQRVPFFVLAKLASAWVLAQVSIVDGAAGANKAANSAADFQGNHISMADDFAECAARAMPPSDLTPPAQMLEIEAHVASVFGASGSFVAGVIVLFDNLIKGVTSAGQNSTTTVALYTRTLLSILAAIPEEQSRAAISQQGASRLSSILKESTEPIFNLVTGDVLNNVQQQLANLHQQQQQDSSDAKNLLDVAKEALHCCQTWLEFGAPPLVSLKIYSQALRLTTNEQLSQLSLDLLIEIIGSPDIRGIETTFAPLILAAFASGIPRDHMSQNIALGPLRSLFNKAAEEEDTEVLVSIAKLLTEYMENFSGYLLKVVSMDTTKDSQALDMGLRLNLIEQIPQFRTLLPHQITPRILVYLIMDFFDVMLATTRYGSGTGLHDVGVIMTNAWVVLAENVQDMEYEFQVISKDYGPSSNEDWDLDSTISSNIPTVGVTKFNEFGDSPISYKEFKDRLKILYHGVFEILISDIRVCTNEIWEDLTKDERDKHWEFRRESFYTLMSAYEVVGEDLIDRLVLMIQQQLQIFFDTAGANWRDIEALISTLRVLGENSDYRQIKAGTPRANILLVLLGNQFLTSVDAIQEKNSILLFVLKNSINKLINEYSEWIGFTKSQELIGGILEYLVKVVCLTETSSTGRVAVAQLCNNCHSLIVPHTDTLLRFWLTQGVQKDFSTRSSLANSLSGLVRYMPSEDLLDRVGTILFIVLDQIDSIMTGIPPDGQLPADMSNTIYEGFVILKEFFTGILAEDIPVEDDFSMSNNQADNLGGDIVILDDEEEANQKSSINNPLKGVDELSWGAHADKQISVRDRIWNTISGALYLLSTNSSVIGSISGLLKVSITSRVPMLRMEVADVSSILISRFQAGTQVIAYPRNILRKDSHAAGQPDVSSIGHSSPTQPQPVSMERRVTVTEVVGRDGPLQRINMCRLSSLVSLADTIFGPQNTFRSKKSMDSILGVGIGVPQLGRTEAEIDNEREAKKAHYFPIFARVAATVITSVSLSLGGNAQLFMYAPEYVTPALTILSNIATNCPELLLILSRSQALQVVNDILREENKNGSSGCAYTPELARTVITEQLLELTYQDGVRPIFNQEQSLVLQKHVEEKSALCYIYETISLVAMVTPDPFIFRAASESLKKFVSVPSTYSDVTPVSELVTSMMELPGQFMSGPRENQGPQLLMAIAPCTSLSQIPFIIQLLVRVLDAAGGAVPRSLESRIGTLLNSIISNFPQQSRAIVDLILIHSLATFVPEKDDKENTNNVALNKMKVNEIKQLVLHQCPTLAGVISRLCRMPHSKSQLVAKRIAAARTVQKSTDAIKQIAMASRGLTNTVGYN